MLFFFATAVVRFFAFSQSFYCKIMFISKLLSFHFDKNLVTAVCVFGAHAPYPE